MRVYRQEQYLAFIQQNTSTVISNIGSLPKGLNSKTVRDVIEDSDLLPQDTLTVNTPEVVYIDNLLYLYVSRAKGDRIRFIAESIHNWVKENPEILKVVVSREALGVSESEYNKLLSTLGAHMDTKPVRLFAYD